MGFPDGLMITSSNLTAEVSRYIFSFRQSQVFFLQPMADIMRESPLWHVIVNWPRALLNVSSRLPLMPMATYSIGELSSREQTEAARVFDCAARSKEKKIIRG